MRRERARRGRAGKQRGTRVERDVREILEAIGFWVGRIAGSLGDVDLVAASDELVPVFLMVEVKSTKGGPFERFGPREREELFKAAELAGAEPVLIYFPPGADDLEWFWVEDWPS